MVSPVIGCLFTLSPDLASQAPTQNRHAHDLLKEQSRCVRRAAHLMDDSIYLLLSARIGRARGKAAGLRAAHAALARAPPFSHA